MVIIIVGSCVKKEDMGKFPNISVAGNKMLLGFAEGFALNDCTVECVSITARSMRRLKKNGEPLVQCKENYSSNGVNFNVIKYVNTILLKQLTISRSIYKELKRLVKKYSSEEIVLCVFNTISYIARPTLRISKKYKISTCGIIADLPIKCKKNFLQKIEDKLEIETVKSFDYLVPLSKYTAIDFGNNTPYCVVEAGLAEFFAPIESENNDVVYTGSLNCLSGMQLLIECAEKFVGTSVKFHVYGAGEYEGALIEAVAKGYPIIYHGRVSNLDAINAQRKAKILICPRLPDDFTTRYTFPSKVLEYMSCGVPVITNDLAGIPDDYYDYINVIKDDVNSWFKCINDIFENYQNYSDKAKMGLAYIKAEKNWKQQTKKVLSFFIENRNNDNSDK